MRASHCVLRVSSHLEGGAFTSRSLLLPTTIMVVVLAVKPTTQEVLIGQTSDWLIKHPTFGLTKEQQHVKLTQASTEDEAFDFLLGQIPTLVPPNSSIQIKIPRESIENRGTYFTGKYYSNLKLHKPGFIKGAEKTGESLQKAAQREFEEETGIRVKDTRFKQCGRTNVFRVKLNDQEAARVEASWKAMNAANKGEVFNLKWTPIATLDKATLNPESEAAYPCLVATPGGKRRTRKSLRTKRRHTTRRRL
jgi:predicted NUDIX family NTP pyrophosphohydrolase